MALFALWQIVGAGPLWGRFLKGLMTAGLGIVAPLGDLVFQLVLDALLASAVLAAMVVAWRRGKYWIGWAAGSGYAAWTLLHATLFSARFLGGGES